MTIEELITELKKYPLPASTKVAVISRDSGAELDLDIGINGATNHPGSKSANGKEWHFNGPNDEYEGPSGERVAVIW